MAVAALSGKKIWGSPDDDQQHWKQELMGAIAGAAQATSENKLKVTAIEVRPAKKR